jgi:outer membrane protein assembly factor BamB
MTMSYNAATPVVSGDTIILTAPTPGTKAFKITKTGDTFAAKELWFNDKTSGQFCTPVVKDGRIYGISAGGNLFCLDAESGKQLWAANDRIGERGFGTMVAAGPVMIALTPASEMVVFKPAEKYEEVAKLKVADTQTHAYPVMAGNRIVIKDRDSVLMYEIE